MSESQINPYSYCSYVGVQYLVCECGEAYQTEEALRNHLEQKHPLKKKVNVRRLKKVLPPITEYKCGECGQVYSTEAECIAHQEVDHIPFMEELVYEDANVEEGMDETILPELVIPSTSSVEVQNVEPPQATVEQTMRVQSLPTTRILMSSVKKRKARSSSKKRKPYVHQNVQCETCGKKYASNAAMRYHQRVHTGVRPYQCMYCEKSFTMALFLQVHVRTHTGEKPYRCKQCPKAFGNQAALLRHDRVHTGIKPYQCPKCGKCFTQSNSLKLHFHTVHLKMPTPYKSKRRKAESDARRSKTDSDYESQVETLPPQTQEDQKVYYEIKTPAGRKIRLSSIVPRKTQEKIQPRPAVKIEEEEASEQEGELYYEIKPEMIDQGDVAYEVVFE